MECGVFVGGVTAANVLSDCSSPPVLLKYLRMCQEEETETRYGVG